MANLDLSRDVVSLTADLVDIASESLNEKEICDAVESSLAALPHLDVVRDGHTLVARTSLGRAERVVVAGHLDTVPANANFPSRLEGDVLWGLGSCDMKGGVAVALRLAAHVREPNRDLTLVFYEGEEIEHEFNGLGRVAREHPELLTCDFAILMEPSDAVVEAGCQGTLRVDVITRGERSHSARSWLGSNAIHAAAEVLNRLTEYTPREVEIDGLLYREGMNAVGISGGVAGNVVPDEARVSVNFRFAPDLDEKQALSHVRELFDGFEIVLTDTAPSALPGLSRPAAAAFVDAVGVPVRPKYGWTDVAQFTQLGIPAVNFGPGNPMYAHKADEHVPVDQLIRVEEALTTWLT
ncbi:succinyl-diaminopimelate desuccinylase [Aeromicrobium sp.]|uniref:succinyl-diaminopimelate desuccinylase n=1 Tax=Aeromicrobium sp. TaxID=1871063 RepID=UPI003D6C6D90